MNTDALDTFQLDLGTASETGMAIVLGVMMFAVALGLRPSSFSFFKTQPRVYITGIVAQIIRTASSHACPLLPSEPAP